MNEGTSNMLSALTRTLNPHSHVDVHRNEYGRIRVSVGVHLPFLRWTGIKFMDGNWHKDVSLYPPVGEPYICFSTVDGKTEHVIGRRFIRGIIRA